MSEFVKDAIAGPGFRLPLARFRLVFRAAGPAAGDGFSGSAWRGAFGHALKRSVCTKAVPACEACDLRLSCPYPYLFETPLPADARVLRGYSKIPHPFVLDIPLRFDPQSPVQALGLTLFGDACVHLGVMVHAFRDAAGQGLHRFGAWELESLLQESGGQWLEVYRPGGALRVLPPRSPSPPPAPERVRVTFHTPLRMRVRGAYLRPAALTFTDLFRNVLGRISSICLFHARTPLQAPFRSLVESSRAVASRNPNLHWFDWQRYSTRQQSLVPMGGITGSIEFQLGPDSPHWPFLWLGQYTHAGKGSSMGLGRYGVEALPSGG